jgi:hypothetical protein
LEYDVKVLNFIHGIGIEMSMPMEEISQGVLEEVLFECPAEKEEIRTKITIINLRLAERARNNSETFRAAVYDQA